MTHLRRKYSLLAALALSMTVTLSACGASDEGEAEPRSGASSETPTETPTEAPTEEPTEEPTETEAPTEEPEPAPASNNAVGETYSFEAPKGWKDATKELSGGGESPLELAFMNSKTNESLNVVVIEGQLSGVKDPATKDSIRKELEGAGFKNVTFPGDSSLDGEDALLTISEMKVGAKKFYSYQVFAVRNDMNYVVTVGGFDLKTVEKNVELVSSTWRWTDA